MGTHSAPGSSPRSPTAPPALNLSEFSTQAPLAPAGSRAFSLPQIVLSEWGSEPPSPEAEAEVLVERGRSERGDLPGGAAGGELAPRRGRKCPVSPGSSKKSPSAAGYPPASALRPPNAPSQGCALAAAETWGFPSLSRHKMSRPVRGGGGDAALNAASWQGDGSKTCHRGPLNVHPPCPREKGAGEGVITGTSTAGRGSGDVLRLPGDRDPPGGTRQSVRGTSLPPGDCAGLCKPAQREEGSPAPACPVPHPRAVPGRDPALRGHGRPQDERHQEQVTAFSSLCSASLGRDSATPVAGGEGGAGGLCKGQVSPRSGTLRSKICEGTYQRLDSLEETIRELEITISEISSHPSVEFVLPKELRGAAGASEEPTEGLGDLSPRSCDDGTVLDLSQPKDDAPKGPSPSKTKPPLLPKPQVPATPQVYFLFSLAVLCPGLALMFLFLRLYLLLLCDSTSKQSQGGKQIFFFLPGTWILSLDVFGQRKGRRCLRPWYSVPWQVVG